MLLSDYLSAELFLENSIFESLIETNSINEAFKSDIVRKLANSTVFRQFPKFSEFSIPKKDFSKIDKEKELKWRNSIGKQNMNDTFYRELFRVKLDQLSDDDFIRIDPSDARRKKYSNGLIFWMDENDDLIAISRGNYVKLVTQKIKAFSGKTVGDLDSVIDQEKYDGWDIVHDRAIDDKGNPVGYESRNARIRDYGKGVPNNTLAIQKNLNPAYCYFLSDETIAQNFSSRESYRVEPSDDEIRTRNIERYEKSKMSLRQNKHLKNLIKYKDPLNKMADNIHNDFEKLYDYLKNSKGGIDPYAFRKDPFLPLTNDLQRLRSTYSDLSDLVSAIRNFPYNYTTEDPENARQLTKKYEEKINKIKENIDSTLESYNL